MLHDQSCWNILITTNGLIVERSGLRGMQVFLNVSQILVSVLVVITILLQVESQGGGLFGGSDTSYRTRRGLEKTLFQFTIVLVVAFIGVSLASVRLT